MRDKIPKEQKHFQEYDALLAEAIEAEARDIKPRKIQKSGVHKGSFASIKGDGFCFITRPHKWVREKKDKDNKRNEDGYKWKKE